MSVAPFRPRAVLVTGGAGFIGSNLVRRLLAADRDVRVVTLDALTYAGNLASLADVDARHGARGDARYAFVHGDVCDEAAVAALLRHGAGGVSAPDAVLHLAAESHVDRSIAGPAPFVRTNVVGTQVLLDAVRVELAERPRAFRVLHVGTDEVYGALEPLEPPATEERTLAPNSPYAASKAAADQLVRAWTRTYGLPCITARCGNNYGPYQFPEKLIPLAITNALAGDAVPVYGDGRQVRDWIHVEDHCDALLALLGRGEPGEIYNVGGGTQRENGDVVRAVLRALDAPAALLRAVADRPAHDRRYALDGAKLARATGWRPGWTFDEGLAATVRWYRERRDWWEPLRAHARSERGATNPAAGQ